MGTARATPIFIVDDDESIRTSLRRLLISSGYNPEIFSGATSFLDSVPMSSQGILILDWRMPGMDGFQVLERLKEFRSPLKIILITAHAQPGDRERAITTGAFGFLQKPFNDQSLLDLLVEQQ